MQTSSVNQHRHTKLGFMEKMLTLAVLQRVYLQVYTEAGIVN
jgi:hypothetical protein